MTESSERVTTVGTVVSFMSRCRFTGDWRRDLPTSTGFKATRREQIVAAAAGGKSS